MGFAARVVGSPPGFVGSLPEFMGFVAWVRHSPFARFAGCPSCDFYFDPHLCLCLCFCCLFGCHQIFIYFFYNFFSEGEKRKKGYLSFLVFLLWNSSV